MKKDSLPSWTYNGAEVTCLDDFPPLTIGYTYKLTFSDSTYYVGSKQFLSIRGVYSKAWLTYLGSSKPVKEALSKGEITVVKREIIDFAISKQQLAYKETSLIICGGALEDDKARNGWVKVNIYKTHIINPQPMKITPKRKKKK